MFRGQEGLVKDRFVWQQVGGMDDAEMCSRDKAAEGERC